MSGVDDPPAKPNAPGDAWTGKTRPRPSPGPDSEDTEYWIAYDVERRKVGCVLIQAALGGDVPRDLFLDYFGVDSWTVSACDCQVLPIRRSQLAILVARTNFEREIPEAPSSGAMPGTGRRARGPGRR